VKAIAESIRRVGLIANTEKSNCAAVTRRVIRLLKKSGRSVLFDPGTAAMLGLDKAKPLELRALAQATDLLLVIGGDGTMLRVGREIAGETVPVLGINAGNLGFLTAISPEDLDASMKRVLAGRFTIEDRALLEATIQCGKEVRTRTALNDFVLSRGETSRLIEVEVTVNDQLLTRYRCDGLIVSSPTGSTAYSLAAGGAIVSPDAEVLILTPICPHTLSIRPLVLNLNSIVRVKLLSRYLGASLTADGQDQLDIGTGDTIQIRRSPKPIRLLQMDGNSFFSTLRQKFAWSGSNV
jgi:NAD+ kinase